MTTLGPLRCIKHYRLGRIRCCLSGLHRMLTNPIYMGIIYKPEWNIGVQGDFEPLVDRETFELANHQIKKGGKRASSRTRNKTDFPCVVSCAVGSAIPR